MKYKFGQYRGKDPFVAENNQWLLLSMYDDQGYFRYNKNSKRLSIKRHFGLYSNLTVALYGILAISVNGYPVKSIELILAEYFDSNFDIHSTLFNNPYLITDIDWSTLSDDRIHNFLDKNYPSDIGLGDNANIDLDITKKMITKYFSPNTSVLDLCSHLIAKHDIDFDNTVFIWARKTDKFHEVTLPNTEQYIKVLNDYNLCNKHIIIQTDDSSVLQEFRNYNIKFDYFSSIPMSSGNKAFHTGMSNMSNQTFYNTYDMSKIEYLQTMLAISILASRSKYFICYPGNPSTYIPILRGSYKNCFLFKNRDSFLYKDE